MVRNCGEAVGSGISKIGKENYQLSLQLRDSQSCFFACNVFWGKGVSPEAGVPLVRKSQRKEVSSVSTTICILVITQGIMCSGGRTNILEQCLSHE